MAVHLMARVLHKNGKIAQMEIEWDPPHLSLAELLECVGSTPLPPYMRRKALPSDR